MLLKSKIKILIKKWIYPVDVYIKILKSGGMALKVGGLTLEKTKRKKAINTLKNKKKQLVETEKI